MVTYFGRSFLNLIIYLYEILRLTYSTFRTVFVTESQGWRTVIGVIASQIYFTGWQALPIVFGIGSAIGFLFMSQMISPMVGFGNLEGSIQLLFSVVLRELAPLLTALIVIARSGTAVASELGNMKVNREVDALITMGINPLNYIVFPRLIGGALSVLILGCYFAFGSALGGMLSSWLVSQIPPLYFLNFFLNTIKFYDFLLLVIKFFFSGILIFSICSYHGLSAHKSPTEVPVVTTQAVMKSIIYVLFFNIFLSLLYYFSLLHKGGVEL